MATSLELAPGNTHRGDFCKLRSIITAAGLISPGQGRATNGKVEAPSVSVTPKQEEELYGSYSCVFTAVGPVDGRERYGDIIYRMKDDAQGLSWATYSSAYSFIRDSLAWECRVQCACAGLKAAPTEQSCEQPQDSVPFTFQTPAPATSKACRDSCAT